MKRTRKILLSVLTVFVFAFGATACDSGKNLKYTLSDDGTSYSVGHDNALLGASYVTIPSAYNELPITSIKKSAFFFRFALRSVTIPDSVITIESRAFAWCLSLKKITVPDSVTHIEEKAFTWCCGLKEVTLSENLIRIGSKAFNQCHSLKSVTIPDSVTRIESAAFFACCNMTSLTIGNDVKNIESFAFANCDKLTDIAYNGTCKEWKRIKIDYQWNDNIPATVVKCTDGEVTL